MLTLLIGSIVGMFLGTATWNCVTFIVDSKFLQCNSAAVLCAFV